MGIDPQEQGKSLVISFADTAKCDYYIKIEVEPDATDIFTPDLEWDELDDLEQEPNDLDSTLSDSDDSDSQTYPELDEVEEQTKTELNESTEDDSDDSDNQMFPDFNKTDELDMTGNEDGHDNLAFDGMDASDCTEKLCHISSIILKAKSQYFYRLFENADQSSQEKVVSLQIKASEVPEFLKLLEFMHGTATPCTLNPLELSRVLMVGEKFEVKSCLNECVAELKNQCRTLGKELLSLPLAAMKVVLSSDSLEVDSEDHVFKFVMKWVLANYETLEQMFEILDSHLGPLIRYQYMSASVIEKVKKHSMDEASKFMSESLDRGLKYKKSPPDWESGTTGMITDQQVAERAYKCKPVKVVMHQQRHQLCTIYLSFTRDECERLSPSAPVHSERFHFHGGSLVLKAARTSIKACRYFGLSVKIERAPSDDHYMCIASFRSKKSDVSVLEVTHVWGFSVKSRKPGVYEDLFSVPWDKFMEADNPWFVDGLLDLIIEIRPIICHTFPLEDTPYRCS